jgi:hypothetical protein
MALLFFIQESAIVHIYLYLRKVLDRFLNNYIVINP